jgi:hypothetical protein
MCPEVKFAYAQRRFNLAEAYVFGILHKYFHKLTKCAARS